ncbi:hypothetical protein P879_04400 [Paragonimus westermani]|uniref:Autophagy-related protein 13 n=1 Tax=Paragonimus westermani TaxID=34504 RepID=A0A8T0D0E9_9TREM|nr:hypothetical protein P879_04400 [Paragonimus westermani]
MKKNLPLRMADCENSRCIRSFIIKSVHVIVQARNGIVYNTNCISAVGARNNLMVNIEEDPEIGATIKQTLDAGFPVRVHDTISLEILTAWPNSEKMTVEVWQFRLDTADQLHSVIGSDQSPHNSPISEQIRHSSLSGETNHSDEVPVEDFRQSRLFEKLGTLLKAIIVATRLLPAYRLSRDQDPTKYQMCYTLRRGSTNLCRLGPGRKSQQIGRLFSGLAVSSRADSSPGESGDNPEKLDRVFLSCTVHYRPEPPVAPNFQTKPLKPIGSKVHTAEVAPNFRLHRGRARTDRYSVPGATKSPTLTYGYETPNASKPFPRVRPAFVDHHSDELLEEDTDPRHLFPGLIYSDPHRLPYFPRMWSDEARSDDDVVEERDEDEEDEIVEHSDPNDSDLVGGTVSADRVHGTTTTPEDDLLSHTPEHPTAPLQLPFSTVGVSGDRLTHLFVELRERANLDLFQVPPNNLGANSTSQAQSSLFDADALSDELERHEKMLKEFDDFLEDFCRLDPFGPEVRPLAPNPMMPVRPHFGTEPS